MSRRQAERWSQEDQSAYAEPQQAPPPTAAPAEDNTLDQLTKLGQLHESGVLTDEEFAAQKAKILGQ